ncbi:hypothetical protein [Aliiruegeria lutimaris]|uniref:Transferrin-binding protein B C-lobe/N-lobe beta barrel domain-containing protein n=1 Tax=Aliiruegeria lutimaris TaxID=571298 RepID=A0A1G8ZIL1_9RHOB|nr:hypothetical protein [Aliiruegeria lutimaris]SDK14868.1 hypothetical protein SAMN04488026_103244 [Aliiruegeria lutimaris]
MIQKLALLMALLGMLSACGGGDGTNPVNNPGTDDGDDGTELPDGTDGATAADPIIRYEEQSENGNGYASDISYDPATDTFSVNNLGFDGANVYTRDNQVAWLGPFAVYEATETFYDSMTGAPISQIADYKAIYGVSSSGQTNFAIVRTGGYIDYGFGGFVYARNGSVTLPTTGQAAYSGDYAGLRDFSGRDGIEYVTGDMEMSIDFEDFDSGDAVSGYVYNRRVYDTAGNDVTNDILVAMGNGATSLPTLVFDIGPGVTQDNGEIAGTLRSNTFDANGVATKYEEGNYYAVLSGANAEEVVGVIVVDSNDPRYGVDVRETGGFILYR